MTRPTDEELHAWAIGFASTKKESCDDVTADLKGDPLYDLSEPETSRFIYVKIDTAPPQDHTALLMQWPGDEPVIIDATIGQFGGGARVFIGPQDAWIDALAGLHGGAEVREVSSTEKTTSRFSDANSDWAFKSEQTRKQHKAGKDIHMHETLKDHGEKRRRCIIQ